MNIIALLSTYKRKYLQAVSRYFVSNFRNSENIQVVIFAQGRTGSTLLESLLSSTGHFRENGEVLAGKGTKIKHPFTYVTAMANEKNRENFIFHLKIYHLTRDRKIPVDPRLFLKKLARRGWKIIYLHRSNSLNHVLSNMIAQERKGYHKYDDSTEQFKIYVNPNSLIISIKERLTYAQKEEAALKDLDFLKINYEDDLADSDMHQQTVNKILDYCGLERRPCFTSMKKINRSTQKEVIKNYKEIKTELIKNQFEYLLD